jgi:hypothetical protein
MSESSRNQSKRGWRALLPALRTTIGELVGAARERDITRLSALLRGGSPLETTIKELVYILFLLLLFAPVVILPAYYLILALA